MRTVPIAFTAHLIKTNAEMAFFNKTHKKGLAGNGFMNLPCASVQVCKWILLNIICASSIIKWNFIILDLCKKENYLIKDFYLLYFLGGY
jgi:hypothetical protein